MSALMTPPRDFSSMRVTPRDTPRADVSAELDEALSSEVIEIELQSILQANSISRTRHCCSGNFGRSHIAADPLRKGVRLAGGRKAHHATLMGAPKLIVSA
jgi:hypothetical protein